MKKKLNKIVIGKEEDEQSHNSRQYYVSEEERELERQERELLEKQ